MSIGKNMKSSGQKPTESAGSFQANKLSGEKGYEDQKLDDAKKLELINQTAAAVKQVINIDQKPALSNAGIFDRASQSSDRKMLIVFPVGSEHYAVSIDVIKEVVSTPHITPVPQMPEYIVGVANVRGNVLAIVDLATRFQNKTLLNKAQRLNKFVMVIKSEEYQFALLVENVPDTLMISQAEVGKTDNLISHSSMGTDFIKGIIKKDKKLIVWIDLLGVIANDESLKSA